MPGSTPSIGSMKAEFVDISDTRKNLVVEIPTAMVDTEIERVTRDYGKAARIPGFRPGKVPSRLIRQRFREQILHDVAHALIPRAVDEALRERGVEPVDTPDIRDVLVEEGKPLKFTASFDTVPPIDPVDYSTIHLRRPPVVVDDAAVDEALQRLRDRAARYEPVEDRPAELGDTVVVDLSRTPEGGEPDRHENVSIELGAPANPPGFDQELLSLGPGAENAFTVTYPADHAIAELAGTSVQYVVAVKAIKRRVLPDLDDEFAKDVGDFETLAALRDRVRADLQRQGEAEADRQLRSELLKDLAARVPFDVPDSLVEREVERRLEEFAHRLMEQGVDPRRAPIDWGELRTSQRAAARDAVAGALVLDDVTRREELSVSEADLEREIGEYAARSGRTPAAVRARLEKDGGISRLYTGLRREKAVDFVLARATIARA
jgi:trigger factor